MSRRILVTGGAGFIGSHLVDALMARGREVVVLDNLSRGRKENIASWLGDRRFSFMRGDLLEPGDVEEAIKGCGAVFHLAANPDVRVGAEDTRVDYEQNVLATYNLLEAVRKSGACEMVIFASSSTVYGEADVMPTPEDYGPQRPVSLYGASKLACEALVSGYAHMFGFRSVILRLANIVGPRARRGVVYDFVRKLRENPKVLEVFGDGTQSKSYLYVDDCVEAFFFAAENARGRVEVYNVGSENKVDVLTIARIVAEEMGLSGVEVCCTGGVDGGRGWRGDVKEMFLDVSKLKGLGWMPKYGSAEAVRLAVGSMLAEKVKA